MAELLVRGLDGEGPGDVVGAFCGEAGASPESIGEVDLDADAPAVEVDDVADDVVAAVDGDRAAKDAYDAALGRE